jgi:hypothetical protein
MLRQRFRVRAAFVVAALYALCVLAPHAAVALGSVAHCLTDDQSAAHVHKAKADVTAHTHADGTAHHHGGKPAVQDDADATDRHEHSKAGEKSGNGNCCGLFCISAIAGDRGPMLLVPLSFAADLPALADALTGHDPGRLNRPPIR